jgi:MATE family multidrug resistance protein
MTYFMLPDVEVLQQAKLYFDIRMVSVPAILLRYVAIGWLLGMQNAKGPLAIMLATNLVNIVLDVYFVNRLGMTVDGVAWASLIADYSGLMVGSYIIYRHCQTLEITGRLRGLIDISYLKRLLNINRDIFIRTLALGLVFHLITTVGSNLSGPVLAANAVLMNFVMIMSYGLDGFAHAVESLSGKALGRNNREEFFRAIFVTGLWSLLCSMFFVAAYWLCGTDIILLMTDLEDVATTANNYLTYLIWLPLLAVWSYWLDGIFIGITKARAMRDSMLFAVFMVFIPLLFLVTVFENDGLWLAFYGFMIARGLSLGIVLVMLDKRNQLFLSSTTP